MDAERGKLVKQLTAIHNVESALNDTLATFERSRLDDINNIERFISEHPEAIEVCDGMSRGHDAISTSTIHTEAA